MILRDMAQEYKRNTALMELRMQELQVAQKRAEQKEVKYRLKQRIGRLRTLINESRKTAFEMEYYYEKGGAHHENNRVM